MKNKKLRLRPWVKNALGIIAFYSILIIGIILLNARMGELNQQKSADVSESQTAQINH